MDIRLAIPSALARAAPVTMRGDPAWRSCLAITSGRPSGCHREEFFFCDTEKSFADSSRPTIGRGARDRTATHSKFGAGISEFRGRAIVEFDAIIRVLPY